MAYENERGRRANRVVPFPLKIDPKLFARVVKSQNRKTETSRFKTGLRILTRK